MNLPRANSRFLIFVALFQSFVILLRGEAKFSPYQSHVPKSPTVAVDTSESKAGTEISPPQKKLKEMASAAPFPFPSPRSPSPPKESVGGDDHPKVQSGCKDELELRQKWLRDWIRKASNKGDNFASKQAQNDSRLLHSFKQTMRDRINSANH